MIRGNRHGQYTPAKACGTFTHNGLYTHASVLLQRPCVVLLMLPWQVLWNNKHSYISYYIANILQGNLDMQTYVRSFVGDRLWTKVGHLSLILLTRAVMILAKVSGLICYLRGGSRRSCSWTINISFGLLANTANVPTTVYGTVQCATIDAQTTLVKLNIDDSPVRS